MYFSTVALILHIVLTTLRYIPPKISHEDTNIKNSQNTALFLVSCYQYVFSGVVLSAGKPFRKPATSNGMFPSSKLTLKQLPVPNAIF